MFENNSTTVRIIKSGVQLLSATSTEMSSALMEKLFTTPRRRENKPQEDVWMGMATESDVPIDKNRSVRVYTFENKNDKNAPTVILSHGWSGSAAQLSKYVPPLLEQGFRVVSFDYIGHGKSQGKQTAMPEFVQVLKLIAEDTENLYAIIGHSMGTAAASLAVHWGIDVERLVYLAPPESFAKFLDRLGEFAGFSEQVARFTQFRLERKYGVSFDEARGANIAPKINIPVLIAHGEKDFEVPAEEGEYLASLFPQGRFISREGLGHNRIINDNLVMEQILDFLMEPFQQKLAQ